MRVEVVAPQRGVRKATVQAGASVMSVAEATDLGKSWRVRALLSGHEEIVATEQSAVAMLLEDVHELFPGERLELLAVQTAAPLCESCGRREIDSYRVYAGTAFGVCSSCVLDELNQVVA